MALTNARLAHAKDAANFGHGKSLVVIESDDEAIGFFEAPGEILTDEFAFGVIHRARTWIGRHKRAEVCIFAALGCDLERDTVRCSHCLSHADEFSDGQ